MVEGFKSKVERASQRSEVRERLKSRTLDYRPWTLDSDTAAARIFLQLPSRGLPDWLPVEFYLPRAGLAAVGADPSSV
jgi:hypothetical protein